MSTRVAFTVDEKIKDRLEEASDKTGLSQSEIARRGVVEQVQDLGA